MNKSRFKKIFLRWKIFSDHLLGGTNATDAYIRAGYRTTSRPSAQAAAARLRQHPRFAIYHSARQRQHDIRTRRKTLHILRSKLHTLDQIIHTSAAQISKHQQHLIKITTLTRPSGRVTHLPCKLTAIRRYFQLTGLLPITKIPQSNRNQIF